jgi:hypothetical protein
MNAIRIRKKLDSATLHLPELLPLVGRTVEIIVLDEGAPGAEAPSTRYDAFFELAGKDAVDPEAYKQLRDASMI